MSKEICQCGECSHKYQHSSDCAVHNEPAMPKGKCSCRPKTDKEHLIFAVRHLKSIGFQVSEISEIFGYKNNGSINYLLNSTTNNHKETCPICNGSGKIDRISDLTNTQKKTMQRVLIARKLKLSGWSYRRIMKKMNLKSTSTIDYYLKHGQ